MRRLVACTFLVVAVTAAAQAQTWQSPENPGIARIAAYDLPDSEQPSDYLRAAQGALMSGRPRVADDALEMAQTRMLDRSVPLGRTNSPSNNVAVAQIAQARQALAAHDRNACLQLIENALRSVTAQGL